MGKDFQVTVHEPARREEWLKVFGTDTMCVTTGFPVEAMIFSDVRPCYMLDMDLLTNEQRDNLVRHITEKFGMQASEVIGALKMYGMPILAEDCTLKAGGDGVRMALWMLDASDHDDDFDYFYDLDDPDWQD